MTKAGGKQMDNHQIENRIKTIFCDLIPNRIWNEVAQKMSTEDLTDNEIRVLLTEKASSFFVPAAKFTKTMYQERRENAPPGMMWVADFARRERVNSVSVIHYCDRGAVPGAVTVFGIWYIPEDTHFYLNEKYRHGSHELQQMYCVGKQPQEAVCG
jgi:hypothetical protein